MSTHKGDEKTAKGKDDAPETASNTTSAGKATKATDGPADAAKAAGTAVYPPSPSDQSGEKTDNVAPTKRLPPDAPAQEADELGTLRAQVKALAAVVRNLGGNPDEVMKTAAAGLGPVAEAKAAGPVKKATVNGVEVEYPAHADNPDAAAKRAYMDKAGIWSLPQEPAVEHHADEKHAKGHGAKGHK